MFISWLKLGITGFMLSVMLSDFLSGLSVWLIAGHDRFFSFRFVDKELLEVMLRFSLPLIPTAILWIITGFSDRLFLRHMVGKSEAGVYSAAAKVPNLVSMVSTVFYQAWNMSAIAENNSRKRSEFYTQVYDAYQALLVLASGSIIAFDRILSALLIRTDKDPAYGSAYLYTPVLVIAVLLMCCNQFLSSIYTVSRQTKNSFWTSLIAAALNLLLNAILIPLFGVNGAIAATVASYLACYMVRIVDTRRLIPFDVNHRRFAANIGILFLMSLLITKAPRWEIGGMTFALLLLLFLNYRPLMATAKKLARR